MPFASNRKTLIVITGASKGFGRALATSFAQVLGRDSHFVLTGRDESGLRETQKMIVEGRRNDDDEEDSNSSNSFTVTLKKMDLAAAEATDFETFFRGCAEPSGFQQLVIVHNAGSIGDVSKGCRDMKDPRQVSDYFSLNLSSTIALNSAFLDYTREAENKVVVHVTSLCGIRPFKNMSLYCTGKAARDMFFQVLALEEPDIQVLAWSPGPLEGTDMSVKVRTETGDAETRKMFEEMHEKNSYIPCGSSAVKMIETLSKNDFVSGAHIDYFD